MEYLLQEQLKKKKKQGFPATGLGVLIQKIISREGQDTHNNFTVKNYKFKFISKMHVHLTAILNFIYMKISLPQRLRIKYVTCKLYPSGQLKVLYGILTIRFNTRPLNYDWYFFIKISSADNKFKLSVQFYRSLRQVNLAPQRN